MPLSIGPCDPWPVDFDCTMCRELPDDIDPDLVEKWTRVASFILWSLSGRRFGPCPVTVRPCRRACADQAGVLWSSRPGHLTPYLYKGNWYNGSLCGCGSSCSCGVLCEIKLEGPVYDVVEVLIDGAVLDPDAYRVDSPGLLVRTDGDCWPSCQDLAAPVGDPNTLAVTYRIGLPLDEAAVAAVSEYACELLKSCLPKGTCGECKLPQRARQVTRQGVSVQFVDPMDFLDRGRTGLLLVDQWLAAVNPDGLRTKSRVLSPDVRPARRQTWP